MRLEVKNLHYGYNASREVVKGVSFSADEGECIAVLGINGVGKTTMLKCINRIIRPTSGEIFVNGKSIQSMDGNTLAQQIGYVPQTSFLFSTSIRENIRFAKPLADQKEVEKAAYAADLDEDIVQMQEGYDTEVGEMGVSLSGGQKQRLAIARALMVSPELLILDDSLSAVDAKTEKHILERIKKNRADRTTIMVASRLSSVMVADVIIVIVHGTVVERGTHEQLAKNGGWYQKTFEMQRLEQNIGKGDEA